MKVHHESGTLLWAAVFNISDSEADWFNFMGLSFQRPFSCFSLKRHPISQKPRRQLRLVTWKSRGASAMMAVAQCFSEWFSEWNVTLC
jgi:hypothetical protein